MFGQARLKVKNYFYYSLTLSWRGSLSYRNQSLDLQSKSMDWFLYDNGLRHERVKALLLTYCLSVFDHIVGLALKVLIAHNHMFINNKGRGPA